MERWTVVAGVALAGVLALTTRRADACSQPKPDNEDPPCTFVKLWTPSQSFPQNLHGSIHVGTFDRIRNAQSSHVMFDPAAEITVHRTAADRYELVPFSLVTQPGLVTNARQIVISDPVPGQYVVSSPYGTCSADPSPVGAGRLVGTFELEPSVALPTHLGSVTWLGERSEVRVQEVDDGNCGTIEVTTRTSHSALELQLADGALPWADVIDTSLHVDGTLHHGFSRLVVGADGATARFELTRICRSSHPDVIGTQDELGPGPHTFKIVGRIENLMEIQSQETSFTLSCDDDARLGGDDGLAGGCSATGSGRGTAWLGIALAIAGCMRRRRR